MAAIRGETGASMMESRIIRTRLTYIQEVMRAQKNELLTNIIEEIRDDKKNKWTKITKNYLNKIACSWGSLQGLKKEELIKKIDNLDTMLWREELGQKSSLVIYREWKKEIGNVDWIYDNTPASEILFRARTNTLNLRDRKRFKGEETKCLICGEELENLQHFLLECEGYKEERITSMKLQQPYRENRSEVIGRFLFEIKNEKEAEVKETIYKMWWKRGKIEKEIGN